MIENDTDNIMFYPTFTIITNSVIKKILLSIMKVEVVRQTVRLYRNLADIICKVILFDIYKILYIHRVYPIIL